MVDPVNDEVTSAFVWRDFYRRMKIVAADDVEQAARFAERAAEVRGDVASLLQSGLTEGAAQALESLAEGDMVDFGILVDLAEPVPIPDVTPLDHGTRRHLAEFLAEEPWRSLAVDTDIAVVLGMLKAAASTAAPWFEAEPELVRIVDSLLMRCSGEQLQRFTAEVDARLRNDDLPAELTARLRDAVHAAARRLGTRPPAFLQA